MPPPAKPKLNRFLQRPLNQLQNGQQSSPCFSRAAQDGTKGTAKIAPQAGNKRGPESDAVASMPSSFAKQAIPGSKRTNEDGREKNKVQSENKKPAKSTAKQVVGGEHGTSCRFESSQRTQRPSTNIDYEECRLHDRVSREEASIFKSAKSYGQSVEKRRRLGNY